MAIKDNIYYFTKDTFKKVLYGEVQQGFNMSFVIDGTKDSAKMTVYSFNETEIEPYTIVLHEKTFTWWVVSHDKVERFAHEDGFLYKHNVQLLGAIELLNARDLTDCGFNQDKYTIETFIQRLLDLSTFEFATDNRLSYQINSENLDISMPIDYVKTFENYSLLSALREFLNGYNCDVKLHFNYDDDYEIWGDNDDHLSVAAITIIPKTGYVDQTPIQESVFNDIQETKTMDKNSFGTTVISNAENVISTKVKTFPTTGAIRVSGSAYEITADNAFIRMPSNIYKVNWVKCCYTLKLALEYTGFSGADKYTYNMLDSYSANERYERMILGVYNNLKSNYGSNVSYNKLKAYFESIKDNVLSIVKKGSSCTIPSKWQFDPANNVISLTSNDPNDYLPIIYRHYSQPEPAGVGLDAEWLVAEKQVRDAISVPERCIYYEKGKNTIQGFSILGVVGGTRDFSHMQGYQFTDLHNSSYNPTPTSGGYDYHPFIENNVDVGSSSSLIISFKVSLAEFDNIDISNTWYVVNYIPMTDLKIKYDNSGERNDIQLYNQNGKLNDSVALSRLMLSYSKEIESDTITKYAHFYNYSNIPQVGQLVAIGNDTYVINNVSLDFYENEEKNGKDYFIDGQFTMSKSIAVKSLLTNPNTNIRDYGIPQNNNVERKQLYRDFYELGHTTSATSTNDYYLPLEKIMNVSNEYQDYQEHVAVIKLGYNEQVQGHDNWYYQLDTTTYILKKAIYEVVNFNDNNIIGYSSQNTISEFDIQRVLTDSEIDVKNTPISYTDDSGEVESFEIAFCTNEQLTKIYDDFKQANGYGSYTKPLFNYSIFIDKDIYEGGDYGQSYSYIGVINTGTLSVDQFNTAKFEITQYLDGFTGSESDIGIDSLSVYDVFFDREIPSSEYSYSFSKSISGDKYYINMTINPTSTYLTPQVQLNITNVLRGGFVGAKDSNDFIINEQHYRKDAIEVPIFEYSCQIDNSNDVLIGDNILDTKNDGFIYMYSYVLVPKNQVNENNFYRYVSKPKGYFDDYNHFIIKVEQAIGMTYEDNKLKIGFRDNDLYDTISDVFSRGTLAPIVGQFETNLKTHDLMIVRHKVNAETQYHQEVNENNYTIDCTNDLMFIIKNTNSGVYTNADMSLTINHYKIK